MDRRVTPPKPVTTPTWGPPPSCKQALSNEDGDGNEKGKKAKGWIGIKTTLHLHHAFLYTARWPRRENA